MCTHLNFSHNNNVMMYLKLREEGCEKDTARKFCRKQFCKIDQTQQNIGPPGHKILKILLIQNQYQIFCINIYIQQVKYRFITTVRILLLIILNNTIQPDRLLGQKGWQPGFLMKYDLGVGYKESADLNEKFTPAELAILKQYKQYEKKKNAALLQKMLAVKSYADSLRPPKLDVFSKSYLQRVKQISQELREGQTKPKKYFEFGDMKFYALVDYINRLGQNKDLINLKFDPILLEDIKFQTENTQKVNTGRAFRRMGTIKANFIMALQQQAPVGANIEKTKQKPEVVSLLKLNHQKIDLAEEFNSTQYLFTPTNSQTLKPCQINDDIIKSFVKQYYQKQFDDKINSIAPFNRNVRVRTQANSEFKKTPRQPSNKVKTSSI